MPTYEYECKECGHLFEKSQQMTDKPAGKCPQCRGMVRRLVGTGGSIVVKGAASKHGAAGCSLENTGRTFCGRDARCDSPACEATR